MKVQCFTVGMFDVNTYLLTDEETGHGNYRYGRGGTTRRYVEERKSKYSDDSLNTRTHRSCWSIDLFTRNVGCTYIYASFRKVLFDTLPMQGSMFGMPALNRPCGRIDHLIDDGFELMLGNTKLKFLSTPGHTQVRAAGMMNTTLLLETRYLLVVLVEPIFQ